ncbi:MAG: hypothetical protein AAFY38_08610 [Pseudomonadota bacterium]
MTRILAMLALAALAACGADGEPVQPAVGTSITVTDSGVSAGANARIRTGAFTINLGLF